MPDDKLKGLIKDTAKAAEYFGKRRKGRNPLVERMEEAVEGPEIPPAPPPTLEPDKKLLKKSTGGSPPFSDAELKKGYRKL